MSCPHGWPDPSYCQLCPSGLFAHEYHKTIERARTEGAKAERERIVAIVDAHLADLRTAHASSIRDASPHWVRTIETMIDSMTVLRGRIERGDHEPKEKTDG